MADALPGHPPPVSMHLVCDDSVAAIEFYSKAFGATERLRLIGNDGKFMHAALDLNGGVVMLADENRDYGMLSPRSLGATSVTLHLYVGDVDASVARAVAAGATIVTPVADMFWGDRYAMIADPFGHRWSIATALGAPKTGSEIEAAMHGQS
jgi:PhnB protein